MFLYYDWKYEFYQRYITRALITWQWLAKKNCKENISRDVDNEIEGWKIEKIQDDAQKISKAFLFAKRIFMWLYIQDYINVILCKPISLSLFNSHLNVSRFVRTQLPHLTVQSRDCDEAY